jgi:hypothetical protein
VTAGEDVLVGEQGPELLRTSQAGSVINSADTRRTLANAGGNHTYNIDARGTDPALTEERVRRAILTTQNSSVSLSVRANRDMGRRVPQASPA